MTEAEFDEIWKASEPNLRRYIRWAAHKSYADDIVVETRADCWAWFKDMSAEQVALPIAAFIFKAKRRIYKRWHYCTAAKRDVRVTSSTEAALEAAGYEAASNRDDLALFEAGEVLAYKFRYSLDGYRWAFALFLVGFSRGEIARILEISADEVNRRLQKCRRVATGALHSSALAKPRVKPERRLALPGRRGADALRQFLKLLASGHSEKEAKAKSGLQCTPLKAYEFCSELYGIDGWQSILSVAKDRGDIPDDGDRNWSGRYGTMYPRFDGQAFIEIATEHGMLPREALQALPAPSEAIA